MRAGRRDEDVDREVAVERGEPLDRLRRERRRGPARLEYGADQRGELVAPRQAVVADTDVFAVREHGDGGIALEAGRLVLDAAGDAAGERRDSCHDPLRLGAEVDVACSRQGCLLRAERHEQLDRPVELVQQLAHAPFLVRLEDRHAADYRIRAATDGSSSTSEPVASHSC